MIRVIAAVVAAIMLMPAAVSVAQDAQVRAETDRVACLAVEVGEGVSDEDVAGSAANGKATVVGNGDACSLAVVTPPTEESGGPRRIEEATGGLEKIREAAWTKLVVRPDGRTIDIQFWGGDEKCTTLDRVEANTTPTGWDVRVFVGRPLEVRACPAVGLLYVVTVELDTPLFTGGQVEGERN